MDVALKDAKLDSELQLTKAVKRQRQFWRKVQPADIDYLDFKDMEHAATSIASELEKHYKNFRSKSWRRVSESGL